MVITYSAPPHPLTADPKTCKNGCSRGLKFPQNSPNITHVLLCQATQKHSEMDLTFGLLTLSGGSPSEAGPVLIQVKEPDEPFGPTLQFDHLCPGLHYTHASFNCKRSEHIQLSDNAHGYWCSETSLSNKTSDSSLKTPRTRRHICYRYSGKSH